MVIPDWIKYAAGGGLIAVIAGSSFEKYIRNNHNLSDEQKKALLGAAIGTTGGGLAGYHIGDKVVDGNRPDGMKKKILSTIIGAGGGGVIGYFIGEKFGTDKKYNANKPEPDKKKSDEKQE